MNFLNKEIFLSIIIFIFLSFICFTLTDQEVLAQNNHRFEVSSKFNLPGEGSWDYLTYDEVRDRLFIARENRVQVINPKSGILIGEIQDTPGVHGIALVQSLNKGFTSNGRDSSITVFSLDTLKLISKINTPQGIKPDFIYYDKTTNTVVVFNGKSHNVSIIDPSKNLLISTIELAGKPEAAVSDGKGNLFVNIEDKNSVQVIDLLANITSTIWPLTKCIEPSSIAIDIVRHALYIGCHNNLILMLDAVSGSLISSSSIGRGVDSTTYDASKNLVFSSQDDGTLDIFTINSLNSLEHIQTLKTQLGAKTMALDSPGGKIYLVTSNFEESDKNVNERKNRKIIKNSFKLLVVEDKK